MLSAKLNPYVTEAQAFWRINKTPEKIMMAKSSIDIVTNTQNSQID